MPDQGRHGIVTFGVHAQVRGLVIEHQQSLALEKAAHANCNGVGQPGEFVARGCNHPSKPRAGACVIHIDAIEEQHVDNHDISKLA